MDNPVWVYWENFRNKPEPAYITLCRWTMLYNWRDENIIFINPENIDYYLPGISSRVSGIESSIHGRAERLKRKFFKSRISLATKADAIRASVLRTYGGIYADSGTVALGSLDKYFSQLRRESVDFIISQRSSHGRSDFPVSIYGCNPSSQIIQEYVSQIYALLEKTKEFDYNGLGTILLTPIVRSHLDETAIIPERDIMPITAEDSLRLYSARDVEPTSLISENNVVFKLFNYPFKCQLKSHSIEHLYHSDFFVGKLFRHALPEQAFYGYLDAAKNSK